MTNVWSCDFETTTDPKDCRVWAYGCFNITTCDFIYGNNIDDFINWCGESDKIIYFHNLKFDGNFIINYLLRNDFIHVIKKKKELCEREFTTLISDMGQFYTMTICYNNSVIEMRDSLKLIPFSVDKMAKAFNLPISKLNLDYNYMRLPNHRLTDEEVNYLRNDVEIVGKSLERTFEMGMTKLTTGACALNNYKEILSNKYGKNAFNHLFPKPSYDAFVRKAYKGGWCYVNEMYKDSIVNGGIVLDVNSLYPYVMYSKMLPYGESIPFAGDYVYDPEYPLYIISFTCIFEIKKDYLPTIQLKNSRSFLQTEYIKVSKEPVTLTLTNVDFKLFCEHYDTEILEVHGGFKFKAADYLFKDYIDYWIKVKNDSRASGNKSLATIAKLMLNSLYGKFATSTKAGRKVPFIDKGVVKFSTIEPEEKEPVYIPVAAFITSYAREKTIRAAQANYNRFCYADTDSLHLYGLELPTELEIDPLKLGAWKHEFTFKRAKYLRAKCYIEEGFEDDPNDIELKVTCAGMQSRSHQYVDFDNFNYGAEYKGKLVPKAVEMGVVLSETTYKIKVVDNKNFKVYNKNRVRDG